MGFNSGFKGLKEQTDGKHQNSSTGWLDELTYKIFIYKNSLLIPSSNAGNKG